MPTTPVEAFEFHSRSTTVAALDRTLSTKAEDLLSAAEKTHARA
jgi:hypothetical protein